VTENPRIPNVFLQVQNTEYLKWKSQEKELRKEQQQQCYSWFNDCLRVFWSVDRKITV